MSAIEPAKAAPASDAAAPNPEDEVEMGFFEHLAELRTRVMRAMIGLVPAVAIAWNFKEELLALVLDPLMVTYRELDLGEPQIHFANPVDPLIAYMKLAIVGGIVLASPWVFYQVWGFISPGLYKREKLLAIPFVFFASFFFVGGVVFGYLVVFPLGFQTFLDYAGMLPSGVQITPTIMINEYMNFATKMLLAFGVVFEVPVVVTTLAIMDVVTWKQLLAFARWWTVIAAVLAAVLTPPDVASQLIMLIPLVVLYMMSVGIAFVVQVRRQKKAPSEA